MFFLVITLDASEVLDRQEAIEKARRKLQEQHDQKAKEYAEKQKLVRKSNSRKYAVFSLNIWCFKVNDE